MFDFDIRMSKKSNENTLFLSLPLSYYLIFSSITLIVLGSIVFNRPSLSLFIFIFISLLAVSYREEFVLSKNIDSFYKSGIGLFYKTFKFQLKDIDLIEKITFIKGSNKNSDVNRLFQKRFHSIKIYYNNGRSDTLLTVTDSKKEKLDIIFNEIKRISGANAEVKE